MTEEKRLPGWWLVAGAVAIGVIVVGATNLAFSLLTDRPFAFAGDVEPFQVALVAFPFLMLALVGARMWLPWLLGLTCTLLLWGWYLFDGVSYQWNPDGSGANIGLGLILLASPFFITALCLGVFRLSAGADRQE